MILDILIYWRDIALWFLPGLKCRAKILNLLANVVPTECITTITAKLNFLLHIIWELYTKLVSLQPILRFHFRNYAIPLFQSMRYTPSKGGLHGKLSCHGVLR